MKNDATFAICNLTVGNLRRSPNHQSELVTQILLGHPLNILMSNASDKPGKSWFLVETNFDYQGWINEEEIILSSLTSFTQWKNSKKLLITSNHAHTFQTSNPQQIMGELVRGDQVELIKEDDRCYEIRYPDQKVAYVAKNDGHEKDSWFQSVSKDPHSIISTAMEYLGVPYLWGANSPKTLDCSGLIHLVFSFHGIDLPRDASQIYEVGTEIKPGRNFTDLLPGDLLYFDERQIPSETHITHIALYLGEGKYLHTPNMVKINSLFPNDPNFNKFYRDCFFSAKRI